MSWQDLWLFVPLTLGVAGAWLVAWRVSKTGSGAVRGTPQGTEAPRTTPERVLTGH